MTIEQALPQVLEHIDIKHWERPAQLLRLIAALQDGPNPVPLNRQLLEATGRSRRQAHYDHSVLVRLAERDRVLKRWYGPGRQPDAWSIAPIERWRHIPWITARRDVLTAFSSPLPDAAVALWTKRAAQAVGSRTDTPFLEALRAAGLRVNRMSPTPRHMSSTPRFPGETLAEYVNNATDSSAASPLTGSLKSLPPYPPNKGGSEERSQQGQDDPGETLLAAVRSAVQTPVSGVNADRIRRVGRSRTELLERLVAFAGGLTWVKRGTEAAEQVEGELARIDRAPADTSSAAHRAILACTRCDERGLIEIDRDTVARCNHEDVDPAEVGLKP